MDILAMQIQKFNEQLAAQASAEVLEAFAKSIADLKADNIEAQSIGLHEKLPEFSLPNARDEIIGSNELQQSGKIILTFYRGSWCPYCNLQLKALQDHLPEIKAKKATLVAISPESPGHDFSLVDKQHLGFELLTDSDNAYAKQLGIVFKVPDFVLPYYKAIGIDFYDFNKNNDNELPMPAVFVADEKGKIIYKFVEADYTKRLVIKEILQIL